MALLLLLFIVIIISGFYFDTGYLDSYISLPKFDQIYIDFGMPID